MVKAKPKVIVLDIGGVLLDWKVVISKTADILKLSRDNFFNELQNHIKDLELGISDPDIFWKQMADKYNPLIDPPILKKTWIEEQPRIEPSWKLLRKIKDSGYRVVCCTNNWKGTVKRQIELHYEFSLFEFIIDSAYAGAKKPDEKIYRLVEEKVGEKGQDIFFIDDSKENCEGAERIGWQTFQFDYETDDASEGVKKIEEILGLS